MSTGLQPYLGSNVNPASVDEMYHRGLLEEGETLLALFDGILIDENGKRIGGLALSDFVALTDRRLIMWARGFFNDTVDGLPWNDVDVGDARSWDPFHGRVQIFVRLAPVAPRTRRIAVKGLDQSQGGSAERVFSNTLDFMPAEDVPVLARMIGWVGDRVVAGMATDELLSSFAEEFPAPERPEPVRMHYLAPEPEPAPPPQLEAPKRRRWWQFGSQEEQPALPPPSTDLITAYERGRSGNDIIVNGSHGGASGSEVPALEQPGMYDISRGLRLMLEFPRRLKGTMSRAGQMMSGANELLGNVQDPRVRRTAYAGLRRELDRQEEKNGPLAPVAPVVRAVLTLTEPDPVQSEGRDGTPGRRIQVRAAMRNRVAPANGRSEHVDVEDGVDERPSIRTSASVRRPIGLRRQESTVEPPAEEGPPQVRVSSNVVRRPVPLRPVEAKEELRAEPVDLSPAEEGPPQVRVSSSVRRSVPLRPVEAKEEPRTEPEAAPVDLPPAEEGPPQVRVSSSVRRSVPLRPVEAKEEPRTEPEAAPEVPDQPRVPVRRIMLGRGDQPLETLNGKEALNGKGAPGIE